MSDRISVSHKGCYFGKLEFVGSTTTQATFKLLLEGGFDACAIFEALDILFGESYTSNFKSDPMEITIVVPMTAYVKNPIGFTKMWAREIAKLAVICHNDYLKGLEIKQSAPEVVTAQCYCGWQGSANYGGEHHNPLNIVLDQLVERHGQESTMCDQYPMWA